MTSIKKTNTLDIEQKVYRMPFPSFVEVSEKSKVAFLFEHTTQGNLTVDWQLLLTKVVSLSIGRRAQFNKEIFYIMFLQFDYAQINRNAINDVFTITQHLFGSSNLIEIEAKIDSLEKLITEYLSCEIEREIIDCLINEFGVLINQLKELEVIGIGAFMLAASLQLALLQEKANTDFTQWNYVKQLTLEYTKYVKRINPKLYRLTIGRIDKSCKCTKCELEGEETTEYECRYFDGKNIHIFRERSDKVGYECNRHRLKMFHTVVERVNQISKPVRSTIKKWQELIVRD